MGNNFGNYLDEMVKQYAELVESGRDLFANQGDSERVFPLPIRERPARDDGSLVLGEEDIAYIAKNVFPSYEKCSEAIRSGELKIFPYEVIGPLHEFSLNVIKRALEGESSTVHYVDVDSH